MSMKKVPNQKIIMRRAHNDYYLGLIFTHYFTLGFTIFISKYQNLML
jgi:hypothetical protein